MSCMAITEFLHPGWKQDICEGTFKVGAQTLSPEQLCSHGEQCCKAPVHGKIGFTCNGAVCKVLQKEGTGSQQVGNEYASTSHSQTKHEFQIDDSLLNVFNSLLNILEMHTRN